MGCASSKLDDLPAVALCRDRCTFLDEAIHQRYALAQAHVAYFHSLKSVGFSLHRFFDLLDSGSSTSADHHHDVSTSSPVFNLPAHRKGDPQPSASPPLKAAVGHSHSHSHSGSHLHLQSDDDTDSDDDSLHLHSEHDGSPPIHNPYGNFSYSNQNETLGSYHQGGYTTNMNYMRKQPTQSVLYEQRPMSPQAVQFGEASSSSSYYPYPPYPNQNPGYSNSNNNYSNYANYSNYGGFFGSSPPAYGVSSPPAPAYGGGAGMSMAGPSSSSKPPPPPPSPPRGSAWDFLYPFETYEKYYPPYTPSRDSREVREEEGIPDLEDEDYQQEVVKEVQGHPKFVNSGGVEGNYAKAVAEEEDGKATDSERHYRAKSSSSVVQEDEEVEYEVHVVDKKVVDTEERSRNQDFKARTGFRNDSEVVKEIQVQFDRASESGSELATVLEAGKVPHNRKHAAYQVSAKMLNVITPSLPPASSLPSTSTSSEMADPAYLDLDGGVGTRSGNLSSTLHKLYLWEKKLYEEVKIEEKMRILHERKNQKLKRMDERGAEAHKVDVTRKLVRSLSTKIRIAIQVVDKISVKINNLRDGELWPQLNEFIQGLARMWKSMLECHNSQYLAIKEAKRLDSMASHKHFSEAHLEATLQLEHELLNWTLRFSCWFGAQKGYVRALNNWLLKCLLYIPEETPDGIVPFSPGRIGAPPVFVICNQWSQSLDRISEKEVIDCMRDFSTTVLQLWERDKLEMRQRMTANKETERKVKFLEREDQKIHKEIQVLGKKIVPSDNATGLSIAGQAVYQSETSKSGSLQISLQRIFEAMEKFTANSLKVYEELLQRIEEDRLAGEPKVS